MDVKARIEEVFQTSLGIDPKNQEEINNWRERSSMDVVLVTVQIEKAFKIRFNLSDLTSESFASIDGIASLVQEKLTSRT